MNVSEKLRLVQGLHSHAEMFGFKWDDDSDWTWHDVACKIADEVDAENDKLRELVRDVNRAAHMLCEAWEGSCSKEAEGMSLHAVCPISDTNELCVFGKLYDRMRDLGVEVD